MKIQNRKIGIIGIGPRGGYALERFIVELVLQNNFTNIKLCLFEETGNLGNGQVYNLNQHSANWINITERVLDLEKREYIDLNTIMIPSFPSYKEWINKDDSKIPDETPDTYPPRAKLGEYLSQRSQSLINPLVRAGVASVFIERVEEVNWLENETVEIITNKGRYENFDEVLLTIGHQPTKISEQISAWESFVSHNNAVNLYTSPYPSASYLNDTKLTKNSTIGIRGYGLAMIDVVRAVALKFGEFLVINEETKTCEYQTELSLKDLFIPFSLNGLPPVPKPLNAKVDNWFEPNETSIKNLKNKLQNKQTQKKAEDPTFLIEAFAPIASTIFVNLPQNNNQENIAQDKIEDIIKTWLGDQNFKHSLFISNKQSTERIMSDYVEMAIGKKAISLDFCIGQVWRHCQPTLYESLSFNECTDEVFAEIIKLDESTKRYSYGPPVESIQQLLTLAKDGILNLDFVNNPKIELTNEGWKFIQKENSITADLMIDSVLDSPQIKTVRSSLVQGLLEDDIMQAIYNDFGVETDENAYLLSDDINKKIPIALLGRLAKGTIIGVDAILECFGLRPRQWAIQAAQNHKNWLATQKN